MSLKNPKTLKKCYQNLQPQMPDLQFLKTPIFARALVKLQNSVNFTIFSYLRVFPVFIINGSTILC